LDIWIFIITLLSLFFNWNCLLKYKIIRYVCTWAKKFGVYVFITGRSEEEIHQKFESIKSSFQQLRRRTYANKFKLLLHQLKIEYSDVNLKRTKIVSIRNDITHRGQLRSVKDEKKLNSVFQHHKAFWSVLIHIFLKLMNYEGRYFDPYHKSPFVLR
jgi:hypothetical protein